MTLPEETPVKEVRNSGNYCLLVTENYCQGYIARIMGLLSLQIMEEAHQTIGTEYLAQMVRRRT